MQKNLKNNETGRIISFFSGVARIKGLPHVFLHEVLLDETGNSVATVIGFDKNFVNALFFDEKFNLEKPIFRSFHAFSIQINDYVGRIVDGLGRPIDGLGNIQGKLSPVFKQAPLIIDRAPEIGRAHV